MPESKALHTRWALVLVWLVPAFWAVNYIVARKAPGIVGPYVLALGRWALAAMILLFLSGAELWRGRLELARVWWQYLVLGSLGMLICGAWVYQGARSTDAMNIALIYSVAPVLIGLGASLWLGEGFGLRQALGMVLAFAGLLHVIVKGRWSVLADLKFDAGDGWIMAATIAWAGYALLQKKWTSPLSATARLAAICLGGVFCLLPFATWEMMQPGLNLWDGQALMLVLLAAIVPGVGAYWIYGWTQKILGANRVAVSLYLVPLYVSVVAWLVLDEVPGWHHLVGAALILPGVFLVTQIRRPLRARA
jgi:drug/metabolite transporter (DMT)-like permease